MVEPPLYVMSPVYYFNVGGAREETIPINIPRVLYTVGSATQSACWPGEEAQGRVASRNRQNKQFS